jgi:hypothetical protein
MCKRISELGAIALFAVAGPALFIGPSSAQSFPMVDAPFAYDYYAPLALGDGTREGCRIYAEIAYSQADENRRYRCGYAGARWNANPELHFHWCRLVRYATMAVELRDRDMDLQRCLDRLEAQDYLPPPRANP